MPQLVIITKTTETIIEKVMMTTLTRIKVLTAIITTIISVMQIISIKMEYKKVK